MKVLISAYACEPNCGSEPAIGWNVIRGLASRHELTVMTRRNNREAVLGCGEDWVRGVEWVFVDPPRWLTFWKKGRSGVRLFYLIWQVTAFFRGRDLLEQGNFEVIHHLTFASIFPASPLAFLGKPFVSGPLGGALEAPPLLAATLPWRGRWALWRQKWGRRLGACFSFAGRVYRRSSVCLGATRESVSRLQALGAPRVELEVQSGLDPEVLADLASRRKVVGVGGALCILVASRMVFWKGVDLAIEAVARARSRGLEVRLELSESGPEEASLRDLVGKLGLAEVTTFLGRLSGHDEFLAKLAGSDVVMHPAFSESFGQVCLEALACGVPVICLDWGGPGVIVNQETGYLVEPGRREQVVERLSEALLKCADDRSQGKPDPSLLQRRASQFSWERIVDSVDRSYRAAVEGVRTTRPISP